MEPIAVIDFETTGMSPGQNCRATEIAAVIVEDGQIIARYQSLMNSGAWVPPLHRKPHRDQQRDAAISALFCTGNA